MADRILNRVDESRRGFVKRLLGTTFAAPLIASFSIEALSAQTTNVDLASNQTDNQFDENLFLDFFFRESGGGGQPV
jgi:hypothetical protein